MAEYKLRGTEDPRTGEEHLWVTKDGKSMPIEDVVDDLLYLQEQLDECRRLLREAVDRIELHECATSAWWRIWQQAAQAAGGGDE
jgi:hypothetical protein